MILKSAAQSKALRYLDLSGIGLDRRGLAYLGHALAQGSMVPPSGALLESLKMDSCRLKAPSMELIGTVIVSIVLWEELGKTQTLLQLLGLGVHG